MGKSKEGSNAGNGSIMRCAPLAITYRDNKDRLAEVSRQSSLITHADPRCQEGCAILNLTIAGLLREENSPLETALAQVEESAPEELIAALEPIANGREPESLETTGYVVTTLQTALHDALTARSAEQAIITSVNRGGDTDTIGAVTGAVAGARFGGDSLPNRWVREITESAEIAEIASKLHSLAPLSEGV